MFFLKLFSPFSLFEPYENNAFGHYYRTFYQHSIRSQETELLFFRHIFELVLQAHTSVKHTARVEKAFQRQTAERVPIFQFIIRRRFQLNISQIVCNPAFIQPFLRFFARCAFRVANILHCFSSGIIFYILYIILHSSTIHVQYMPGLLFRSFVNLNQIIG